METQGYWYEPAEGPYQDREGLFRSHEGLEVRLARVNFRERYGLRLDCYAVGKQVASLPIGEDGTVHQRSLEKVLRAIILAAEGLRDQERALMARHLKEQEDHQRGLVAKMWLDKHGAQVEGGTQVRVTQLGALEFTVPVLEIGKADLLLEFLTGIGLDPFQKGL
jgi:hypothetical protein